MSSYPTQVVLPVYPANAAESEVVREVSMPIYQSRGWLKFLGILMIIGGIPGIIGLVGILQIWMGIILMQAASSIETAASTGQKYALVSSLGNLKTYFVISGVLALVGIIVALLAVCVAVVLPLLGLGLTLPFLDYNY
ncbi:MAG: DUF5362 family protein [Anaerolineales bacterium]|nr:hypothetical protein [Anaerolinea sp.]MDP2975444.1 DUF5362 family protein [Anaerolineales bacterium]MDP3186609.1 DUF5362 family protein [Anaerolineales bacterium]